MKLSIAMIVKNEEKNLERSLIPLQKLQNYLDVEIVIVDTGSTDDTIDIAKKYTNKVYFHKWNNDFGYMRNISINYCVGDWILVVDADEVLYDIKELANLIKSDYLDRYNGALIKIIDFNKNIEESINCGHISPLLRLFRKDTVKYEGVVHEQPQFKYPIVDSNIRFIHYGYDNNDFELMEYKYKRNLKLLFNQLKENPNSIYTNFQVAASYSMHKELTKALKYIKIAYNESMHSLDKYIYVLEKYCFILYNMGDYNQLKDKSLEALKYHDNFLDFYFYLGESYYKLNDYNNAIKYYKEYLKIHEDMEKGLYTSNSTLSISTRKYKKNILYNLALSYYKIKYYEKSLNTLLKIDDKIMLKERVHVMLRIISEGKLWDSIHLLNGFIDKYNYENILIYLHNEILLEDLNNINKNDLDQNLEDMISIVVHFKENDKVNKEYIDKMKNIIDENKIPYSVYVYYVLKYDINEITYFMFYGKDKIEDILFKLCNSYYDFNIVLSDGLDIIKSGTLKNITARTIISRSLLLSGNLPRDKEKDMFLDYVAERYYTIVKYYDEDLLMEENMWVIPSEDRFIIQLKKALSYKYEDTLTYVKSMQYVLNVEKSYVDYINILIGEPGGLINDEVKNLVPELINNIQQLENDGMYQVAYDTIEEALSLIKFDFKLMVLKYNLLLNFGHDKEAKECLRDIILYGQVDEVNSIIKQF